MGDSPGHAAGAPGCLLRGRARGRRGAGSGRPRGERRHRRRGPGLDDARGDPRGRRSLSEHLDKLFLGSDGIRRLVVVVLVVIARRAVRRVPLLRRRGRPGELLLVVEIFRFIVERLGRG